MPQSVTRVKYSKEGRVQNNRDLRNLLILTSHKEIASKGLNLSSFSLSRQNLFVLVAESLKEKAVWNWIQRV